jgi:hypothetical protein
MSLLKLSNKINYYCWACDLSKSSGEGKLGNLFIKKKLINKKIKIFTLQKKNPKKIKDIFLNYKYISPFIGILFCWYYFLLKKKPVYINYLPLWNFFIFLLLPPKTEFGPITGGALYKNNSLIRMFIFPLFYKISLTLLKCRNTQLIFATDLLKKYINKNLRKKIIFNFVFNILKKRTKISKKSINFLIYYREHKNKKEFFPHTFVKKILSLNFKIHIIGDILNMPKVINYGRVSNLTVNRLLKKTRYSICSGENIFSFFTLECINNNVKILIDRNIIIKNKNFKKHFVKINYTDPNLSLLKLSS